MEGICQLLWWYVCQNWHRQTGGWRHSNLRTKSSDFALQRVKSTWQIHGLDFRNTTTRFQWLIWRHLWIEKITVGTNPYIIHSDSQGDVYVSSRGNYGENPYRFQKLIPYIDEVVQDFEGLNVLNFTIYDDKAYLYNYDFTTNKNWVKVFDCLSEKVVNASFISDNTVLDTLIPSRLILPTKIYTSPTHPVTRFGAMCFVLIKPEN